MRVVALGSLLSDGAPFHMWLERPYSQPAYKLEMQEALGDDPRVTRVRRQALTMQLHVAIEQVPPGSSLDAVREQLLTELHGMEAEAGYLWAADDDGGNVRYRLVVPSSPAVEQPKSEGMGSHFVATLVTQGDWRWRMEEPTAVAWSVTSSPSTLAVTNVGSSAVRPIYRFRPTVSRLGDSGWEQRFFVVVPWRSGYERANWPGVLTPGGGDTASRLGEGESYAGAGGGLGGDNVAVFVNGQATRRWFDDFDSVHTKLWCGLEFQPTLAFGLREGFGAGDAVTTLAVREWNDMTRFPLQGLLLIGGEVFSYDGRDDVARQFLNVQRAIHGSTAEGHAGDDLVQWLQHEVWVVFGGWCRRSAIAFLGSAPFEFVFFFFFSPFSNSHACRRVF